MPRPSPTHAVAAALALTLVERSAGAQLTVSVHPDTVTASGASAPVWVVLRNGGAAPLAGLSLTPLAADSLSLTFEEPIPGTLGARAAVSVRGRVSGTARAGGERIHLRAESRSAGAGEVAFTSLLVRPPATSAADSVVAVRVLGAAGRLRDRSRATFHLHVTNRSDVAVRIDSVRPSGPEFVRYDSIHPVGLPPRGSVLLPVQVRVDDRVQTGKQLLVFPVAVAWQGRDGPAAGVTVATHEVEVGVLGESDVLLALAVPSFLLLPGFLVLVVFGLFWEWLGGKAGIWADPKSPRFWVAAITLSVGMAALYPLVGHDYLQGYGARDVAKIWMASLLLGAAGAAAATLAVRAWERRQAAEAALRTPREGDSPLETLRKLHRRGVSGIQLMRVDRRPGEAGAPPVPAGFRIAEAEGGEGTWVAPAVTYRWAEEAGGAERTELEQALVEGDLARIAAILARLVDQRSMEAVFWWPPVEGAQPRLVRGELVERGPSAFVVPE